MGSEGKLRNMTAIYLTRGESMLLLYRQGSRVVADSWTGTAGGHFEAGELNDARACALRELREETGITENMLEGLRLRYITLRHTKGEVRQNYYYFAELKDSCEPVSNEGQLRWFPISGALLEMNMPFTAKHMLAHYLETGRRTDALYGGMTHENGVTFCELPEF